MGTRVEQYLAHLDRLSGGVEPRFYPLDRQAGGPHKVTNIIYRDVPEPGMLTGLTYGLSTADHEEWRVGRPELCISMASDDERWGHAIGYLASSLVHDCPFAYGDTIDFGEPIATDTTMTAFVVSAPAVMERADYLNVLGAPEGPGPQDVVNIAGMYPIHDSERLFIRAEGLERFWQRDWDPL
ncbi:suppressor of fused domain protein [Knoellia sp. 3-2P3]|uniref:suppressor of fused domain protein n=1 Tax=unclassified Knoellia TaxID=2618719 RepID=UPI0023DC8202|nr:suppressor of fused domain protein [Knoellia sp. 3-2P3]MDF2092227.1 suppressor of fused domain protein [Knoellia sp. 3-2P3]